MNKLNEVFLVVKQQCCAQTRLAEIRNFKRIARSAHISLYTLHIYLNRLQDMGLIRYSVDDNYIYLTEHGTAAETAETKPQTSSIANNGEQTGTSTNK